MFRLIPKSYAATRKARPPVGPASPTTLRARYGRPHDTVAARSAPSIPAVARTRSVNEPGSRSIVDTPARIAPASRMRSVSRRVSTPSMPTTPASLMESSSEPVARHEDVRRASSRTTRPAGWARSDSASSGLTP